MQGGIYERTWKLLWWWQLGLGEKWKMESERKTTGSPSLILIDRMPCVVRHLISKKFTFDWIFNLVVFNVQVAWNSGFCLLSREIVSLSVENVLNGNQPGDHWFNSGLKSQILSWTPHEVRVNREVLWLVLSREVLHLCYRMHLIVIKRVQGLKSGNGTGHEHHRSQRDEKFPGSHLMVWM